MRENYLTKTKKIDNMYVNYFKMRKFDEITMIFNQLPY